MFEDQILEKHPEAIPEAVSNGTSRYTDRFGAEWIVTLNNGPQQMPIDRAGERVIERHHPDGRVTYHPRYVAVPMAGGISAYDQIRAAYTEDERRLLRERPTYAGFSFT